MNYDLPTSIIVDEKEYKIRNDGDFRVILDIISCLNEKDYTPEEKAEISLLIFLDVDTANLSKFPSNVKEALNQMFLFINCGEEITDSEDQDPPFMDWNKDLWIIAPELNSVLGYEVREKGRYTHWWSFVGAYQNIKDGMFSTYVSIRKKLYKGERLDDYERSIYEKNYKKIDISEKWE